MLINQDLQWSGVASEVQMFPEIETLDNDAPLIPDDLFQALSTELGIPLLLGDESCPEYNENFDVRDAVAQESFLSGHDDLCSDFIQHNTDAIISDITKSEIKLEPGSPYTQLPLSPSPSHSESNGLDWQSDTGQNVTLNDFKFTLETPPISPPTDVTPPVSPQPITSTSIIQQVKLVPVSSQDVQHPKYIITKGNPAKRVCIQPKSNTHTIKSDEHTPKTIVLSTKDFAALTQQVKQNNTLYPVKVQSLSMDKNGKAHNALNTHTANIKPTESSVQVQQQNQVKIISAMPNVHVPGRESLVNIPNAPMILKSETNGCTSIVVKNEPVGCAPIFIKKNKSNCTPIIVKSETPDLIHINGRQECEIKALKRQQRMIKNRESACLSRKKKKEYVSALEKQISDLHEENKQLKSENAILKQRLSVLGETSVANKKLGNLNLSVNKKNATILLGMVLMVSLNINGFGAGLMQKKDMDSFTTNVPSSIPVLKHGRSLLWAEPENNIEEQLEDNFNKTVHHPMCPMYINQSESIRLDYELRRWIGSESDQDNWTLLAKNDVKLKPLKDFFLTKPTEEGKRPKVKHNFSRKKKFRYAQDMHQVPLPNANAVEVFSPLLREHASLFEALGRRDDTFYVVWFSGEHLLLPASRKNNTTRPRMSLVLPAVPMNETFSTPANHITMMQIDCEVTNTQLLHLRHSVIPNHLRNVNKFGKNGEQSRTTNDMSDAAVANITASYKPYFIKETGRSSIERRSSKDTYGETNMNQYRAKNRNRAFKDKDTSDIMLENLKNGFYDSINKMNNTKPAFLKTNENIHNL